MLLSFARLLAVSLTLSTLLVVAPGYSRAESCPGCTGVYIPGTEFWVDGYQVSVSPMPGVDPSGKCTFSTTENQCVVGSPCNFGLVVSWVIPAGGLPAAGQWCTSQLTPIATPENCDDTGTYYSSGSANHRERIPCGSSFYFRAWLGESVATFGLYCSGCAN